jgi:L-threonylcarbamoyladenylate synthase
LFCYTPRVQTEIIHALSRDALPRAVEVLSSGGLVAFPTDTVYGVASLPWTPEVVTRLYEAKARPALRAVPLLLSDADQVARVALVPAHLEAAFRRVAARYWPGGLTLVVLKTALVIEEVSRGPTVAIRVPGLALTRELIEAAGGVLAVTSANLSGQPNPVTAQEVEAQLDGRIELILDGGSCLGGVPSTILDLTRQPPAIIRHGIISADDLCETIGEVGSCSQR